MKKKTNAMLFFNLKKNEILTLKNKEYIKFYVF